MPNPNADSRIFEPRMPEVMSGLDEILDKARKAAAEDAMPNGARNRHVAVITPGRMVMLHPAR